LIGVLRNYFKGAVLVVLVTLASYLAQSFLDPFNSALLYVLAIVFTAILWGFGPSLFACGLSLLAHELLYIVLFQNFGPPDWDNVPTLAILLLVGITVSYLAAQVRAQTEIARRREEETRALYVLSRNLAATDDLNASVSIVIKTVEDLFGYSIAVFLPGGHNRQELSLFAGDSGLPPGENSVRIAMWAYEHRKRAGWKTEMSPEVTAIFTPLVTVRGSVGVIAISMKDTERQFKPEQERFFNALADLVAVAIERITFAEESRNMKIAQEALEGLQTAFMDSISHDLRTPLASVLGALGSLKEEIGLDSFAQMTLIHVANQEAENLNHLITNLLDLSRIRAGAIKVLRQPCGVNDIISVALDRSGNFSLKKRARINISPGLSFVNADLGLMAKVLSNLLDNAFKYSGPDSPIDITAKPVGDDVAIEVSDRGIGVPPPDLPHIFDKFHRASNSSGFGTGLGLSICKGLVEAHGGRITAENRSGGGMTFRVILPAADAVVAEEPDFA
jgi:two-component system sensor histidine kinase KdpD